MREDAVAQLTSQLSVMAELGGLGAMTPASYGMFSRRLPPSNRRAARRRTAAILVDGLGRLGEHAREGVALFLEPLNRYEDHMVNWLEDAVR